MKYWSHIAMLRLNRRRALRLSVGGGISAIAAACFSDSGAPVLARPVDSTTRAKAGGTFRYVLTGSVPSLDVLSSNSGYRVAVSDFTYPRLLKFSTATYPAKPTGGVEGDLAESFEIAADSLRLKLRPGLRWDARSPTNGREIDSTDVLYSWSKFTRTNSLSRDIAYSPISPASPVEALAATDDRTIVVNLHRPDTTTPQLLAANSLLVTMPRDADGRFDPRAEVRGYGPYLLDSYDQSVGFTWRKNSDYYVRGLPFLERVEVPIIPDYATRLSQFASGNIWVSVATQEDVLLAHAQAPKTKLMQEWSYQTAGTNLAFGYEGDSPFKDVRVRQATSMLIDRETIAGTIGGAERFRKAGIDLEPRTGGLVGPAWNDYWIDPTDVKRFGRESMYLAFNVEEAKKLIAAAGFQNGFDTNLYSNGAGASDYMQLRSVIAQMLVQGGIRVRENRRDYATDYLPNYHFAYASGERKGFNGLVLRPETAYNAIGLWLNSILNPEGGRFLGATADGANAGRGDPRLTAMLNAVNIERDADQLRDRVQEIARYTAEAAYAIPVAPFVLSVSAVWPVIGNYGYWRNPPQSNIATESALHWWIDDSQPPLR